MKTVRIKILILMFCMTSLGYMSFAQSYIYPRPDFSFIYKDPNPGSTYEVWYTVENTNGWYISPIIYIGNTWTLGSWNHYQSPSPVQVQVPNPEPEKPYRIIVRVRKDYTVDRYGYSDWTDESGLQDNSLYISVTSF